MLGLLGSRLLSLQLRCLSELAPSSLDSIVQLAQLTSLALSAEGWPVLSPLTRLSCLKQLVLFDQIDARRGGGAPMQPPRPADFPGLQRFSYAGN